MESSKFTISEIRNAWSSYQTKTAFQVLRGGEWITEPNDGRKRGRIEGTSAHVIPMQKAMSFPDFLEKVWTK